METCAAERSSHHRTGERNNAAVIISLENFAKYNSESLRIMCSTQAE